MSKTLSEKQLKELIESQKRNTSDLYRDEVDIIFDQLVNLYDKNKIDEQAFKAFASLLFINSTKSTISELFNDVRKSSLSNLQSESQNKVLLLNYTKKSYA